MPVLDVLPTELLILIFSFCIADDPDLAFVLSLVSQQWRTIMLQLPSLWHCLRLSDARFDAQKLQRKTDLWLTRTAALPLDIELDTRHRDSVLPLLSYTLAGAGRWRNVTYQHARMRFLTPTDGEKPRLESLLVTLAPKQAMESDLQVSPSLPSSPSPWWRQRDAPLTKNFQVDKGRLKEVYVLGVRCLPPPEQVVPFDTVTSLMLINSSTECDFPMHHVVPFLSVFPVLEVLELSNFNELFLVHDPEYRPDCSTLPSAELPCLRKLSVRGICSSRCILSHLIAPRLHSLALVHINSSSEYDFPLPGEPGDSDDEAHDFSRSPWTDHATGMGFRRLFARGPPLLLRELVMDYADLRTKDFKWLFARLTHLELFHIVASDMSDNVLRVLEGDADAAPLLPRLTRLKLAKCQKLTGDAVVRMVASRMVAAADGRVSVFAELSITECLQVSELHHQELQAIFPPEGRLHYAPGFEE